MRFLDNGGTTDPTLNLALEEYALLTLDLSDSYLLFYVNRPSIIIGKHQNTIEEIDADFVHAHDIAVVRRISGGGAVYHDLRCGLKRRRNPPAVPWPPARAERTRGLAPCRVALPSLRRTCHAAPLPLSPPR